MCPPTILLLCSDFLPCLPLAEPYQGRLGDAIGRSLLPGNRAWQGRAKSGLLRGCKWRVSSRDMHGGCFCTGTHRPARASSCRQEGRAGRRGAGQAWCSWMIPKPPQHVTGKGSERPLDGAFCRIFSKPIHCNASVVYEKPRLASSLPSLC